MAFSGWHPHLESALVLNLPKMQAQGVIGPQSERWGIYAWRDNDGNEIYRVDYRAQLYDAWGALYLTDTGGTYKIDLSSTPLHFGGRRWWLHCPITSRRALKLYRYAAIGKFCHRTAIRPLPTYASQRVSGLDRIMDRRWALRRKLRDEGDLFCPLQKPKWMRWHTFERYQAKDEHLEALEGEAIIRRWGCLFPSGLGN